MKRKQSEKNWLVRTTSNNILGPISRDKLIELIKKKSLSPQDEICSGNGYWIYIKEQNLVQKYLIEQTPQCFNPIQEAESVLVSNEKVAALDPETDELGLTLQLPDEDDLEYPDAETDDITRIGVSLAELEGEAEAKIKKEKTGPTRRKVRKKRAQEEPVVKEQRRGEFKTIFSVKFLYMMIFLFFLLGLGTWFFRKTLIEKIINTTNLVLPSAYAQSYAPVKKKLLKNL